MGFTQRIRSQATERLQIQKGKKIEKTFSTPEPRKMDSGNKPKTNPDSCRHPNKSKAMVHPHGACFCNCTQQGLQQAQMLYTELCRANGQEWASYSTEVNLEKSSNSNRDATVFSSISQAWAKITLERYSSFWQAVGSTCINKPFLSITSICLIWYYNI